MIFGTFRPENPSVNAHDGIIKIDHHVAKKSEVKENVNIKCRRNNSCRINPDVFNDGKIYAQDSKIHCDDFQNNLVILIRFVGFKEEFVEIHVFKDSDFKEKIDL